MAHDPADAARGAAREPGTALLVIDAQPSLIAEGAWAADAVLARIEQLIGRAREAGSPVVFVVDRRVEPDAGFHPALPVRASRPGPGPGRARGAGELRRGLRLAADRRFGRFWSRRPQPLHPLW